MFLSPITSFVLSATMRMRSSVSSALLTTRTICSSLFSKRSETRWASLPISSLVVDTLATAVARVPSRLLIACAGSTVEMPAMRLPSSIGCLGASR